MADPTEPRALSAALAAPAFNTRGAGLAMHVADRHVERWAPEAGANRVRPLRSLGFVDRLIAPWIETAQRSASLRLFGQYTETGFGERQGSAVSWVFPRPWYQDELDWMAAARRAPQQEASMFTTRGTYVAPPRRAEAAAPMAMPSALYEYVAPSMSMSMSAPAAVAGVGYGGESMHADAYSPLISLAAVQAANLMARAVAPAIVPATSGARMSPALRNVLSAMIERAATARTDEPSRRAQSAPELVTPPAPRAPELGGGAEAAAEVPQRPDASATADRVAQHYAAQRAQIVEVQRIAQRAAEREIAARRAEDTARAALASTQPASTAAPASAAAPASTAPGAERVAELREAARRGEAQLRETAAARTEEQRQKLESERAAAVTAERTRIEGSVAQRVAERTAAQRLHEQARAEAAAHVRAPIAESPASQQAAAAAEGRASIIERRPTTEVAQAIAALPPELAAFIGQRPERAMQAIEELDVALRTIELIARGAASGATFEATRGPRLVMPAGIGGLVSAVDRARAIETPMAPMAAPFARVPAPALGLAPVRAAAPASARVPSLPWLAAARPIGAPQAAPAAISTTTALGATVAAAPAALGHVAWADRWLARFAGASKVSLDTFAAAGTTRMEALAAAAPQGVFVSPFFDIERDAEPTRDVARLVAASERRPTLIQPPAPVIRYADDAETPDDVFAQISAAATRQRSAPAAAPPSVTATTAASTTSASLAASIAIADRMPADVIAASAPSAPNAGLSAQLAASPFAPALRHVMPMPSSSSFDVRSLFGGGLSATYLAGLLSAESRELEIAARTLPGWAAPGLESFAGDVAAERAAPAWDPTYVTPDAPDAPVADGAFDAASADARISPEPAERPEAAIAATAPLTTLRAALLSWTAEVPGLVGGPGVAAPELAGSPESAAAPASAATLASIAGMPVSTARAMLESMSLPMLGDVAGADDRGGAWMAPGMVASRAHSWSVAQERSVSDLALDFVTPELVLAARVYGLGPSEAAQAARLAIAGSGHLTAMAGAVDRTFLQAMAMDADRRERLATLTTAYPVSAGSTGLAGSTISPVLSSSSVAAEPAAGSIEAGVARAESPRATAESLAPMIAGQAPVGTAFGVDRRPPRGAFLWPSASVAALGLNATAPEGQQAMSVAALELLAARAVAELGTFAALEEPGFAEAGGQLAGSSGATGVTGAAGLVELPGVAGAEASTAAGPFAGLAPRAGGAIAGAIPAGLAPGGSGVLGEPGERDVLAAASELVPSARRARFDALYLALGQSTAGRSWSPAARAARALALAGQTDEVPVSARERAASAWDVLPIVYASEGLFDGDVRIAADGSPITPAASSQGVATRASRGFAAGTAPTGELVGGYAGAGLGGLSARAGEALGSYVAPFAVPASAEASSSSARDRGEQGAVLRPPTAMQELVRTGRSAGRHGGGEVEIPPWFEAAARKMFESQGSISDGISIAELTLVTAAPSTHIAASTRTPPSAAPPSPASGSGSDKGAGGPGGIDVESTAQEIYRYILTMMDAARARNGEPYL